MKKLIVLSFVLVSLLVSACTGRTGTGTDTNQGTGRDTMQSDTTMRK